MDEIDLEKEIRKLRCQIIKPVLGQNDTTKKLLVVGLDRTLMCCDDRLEKWDFVLNVTIKIYVVRQRGFVL